jgi:hypothetical protein
MNPVPRNAVKISRFAEKAALFDKKPDFAFEHVVDLLGFMRVGSCVIPRSARRIHEAALVAVPSSHNHRAFAFHTRANNLALRHIGGFDVQ